MANSKKIFFAFLLFFLAFSVKSYSEIVTKVNVKGNERISLETIVVFGDIVGKIARRSFKWALPSFLIMF